MSNALKFTRSGGKVGVDVSVMDGPAELRIVNNGSGVPAAFLPFVFDKFRQADASFTRQHGGLGFGLAIAHPPDRAARRLDRSAQRGRGIRRDLHRPASAPRVMSLLAQLQRPQAACPTTYQIAITEKGTPSNQAAI